MGVTKRKKVGPVDPMAVVTRFIDAANHHDVDALRACVHREFESVQPIHPGRNFRGPGQLISNWKAIFEAEPGFRLSVRRASVTDNTVWVEVHGAGASAEAAGIFIVGIEDGRIRWIRVYSDLVEPVPEPPEPEPEPQPALADEVAAAPVEADGEGEDGPRIRLVGEAGAGEVAEAVEGEEPPPALTLVQPSTQDDPGVDVVPETDGVDDVLPDAADTDDVAATVTETGGVTDTDTDSDTAESIWAARPDEVLDTGATATDTGDEPAGDLPDVGDTVAGLGFTEPEPEPAEPEAAEPEAGPEPQSGLEVLQPATETDGLADAPAEAPDRAPGGDEALVLTPETSEDAAADDAAADDAAVEEAAVEEVEPAPPPPEPVTTRREGKLSRRRWRRGRGD